MTFLNCCETPAFDCFLLDGRPLNNSYWNKIHNVILSGSWAEAILSHSIPSIYGVKVNDHFILYTTAWSVSRGRVRWPSWSSARLFIGWSIHIGAEIIPVKTDMKIGGCAYAVCSSYTGWCTQAHCFSGSCWWACAVHLNMTNCFISKIVPWGSWQSGNTAWIISQEFGKLVNNGLETANTL